MRIATKTTRIRAAKAPEKTRMLSSKSIDFFLELAADKKYADAAKAVLREIMGAAAPEEEPASEEPPPAEPPAAKMDEEPAKAARMAQDAPADDGAMAALGRAVVALMGANGPGDALAAAKAARIAQAEQEQAAASVAADAAKLEASERRALVVRLQAIGVETPALSGLAAGKLVPRLEAEPIADLRARVVALEAIAPKRAAIVQPKAAAHPVLTEQQRKICKETGCDEEVFAARIKARKV